MISQMNIKTKAGMFHVEASDKGVRAVKFGTHAVSQNAGFRRGKAYGHAAKTALMLRRYFQRRRVSFGNLKCDLSGLSVFEKRVLAALAKVPSGKVVTYRELARLAGSEKAIRAVGSVMRKNRLPILLPCHRVVRSDGKLGNYSGGVTWKRRLLEIEGWKG